MEQNATSPVSFVVNVARLPRSGMPVSIEADATARIALALAHSLAEVRSYRAELLVTAWNRNGIKVEGRIEADIVQECIVTLEPIESAIRAPVEGLFLPQDSKLGRQGFGEGGEILLDAEGPDSPETFTGDTIDVGAFAEEFFALAIDPYPRKGGASLAPAGPVADEEPAGPLQESLRALLHRN